MISRKQTCRECATLRHPCTLPGHDPAGKQPVGQEGRNCALVMASRGPKLQVSKAAQRSASRAAAALQLPWSCDPQVRRVLWPEALDVACPGFGLRFPAVKGGQTGSANGQSSSPEQTDKCEAWSFHQSLRLKPYPPNKVTSW